jgi:hypothetical protein
MSLSFYISRESRGEIQKCIVEKMDFQLGLFIKQAEFSHEVLVGMLIGDENKKGLD